MKKWPQTPELPKLKPINVDNYWNELKQKVEKIKGLKTNKKTENSHNDSIPNCIKEIQHGMDQGSRDNTAYGYASHLKQQGLTPEAATSVIQDWNKKNRPPLPQSTIINKITSAYKTDKKIGCNWWKSHGLCKDPGTCPITQNKNKNPVPLSIAETLMETHTFKTTKKGEDIYYYKDGVYHPNGEIIIKQLAQETLSYTISTHLTNEIIGCIQRATYTDNNELYGTTNINLINLQNGIYNITTGKLEPHTPNIFTITQIPINYDPGADCPHIKQFLEEILTPHDIPIIQELIGYCLYRGYPIQKSFMFIGGGANGKSTLLGLIKTFLGTNNIASIDLHEVIKDRFSRSYLMGKLANLYPDITSKTLTTTGVFKTLTGGDTITADRKFRDPITFINHAKLIFSANQLPTSMDETDAYYRRWIITNFPNVFEGDNCNPHILNTLTTPQELSGLFNWAITGLKRLLEQGEFSHSITTEETRKKYIRMASTVACFVEDCLTVSPEGWISKDELYSYYAEYCRKNFLPITPKNIFSMEIHQYIRVEDYRPKVDNKRIHAWKGIQLCVQDVQAVHPFSHLRGARDIDNYGV